MCAIEKRPPILYWRSTEVRKARFYLGVGESRVYLLIELINDVRRRAFWRPDALPCARLVAGHKFAHGRNVRQLLRARCTGHRQSTQPPGPDVCD